MLIVTASPRAGNPGAVDDREQLVNNRERGPITSVSVASDLICQLHGFLLDIDPSVLHPRLLPNGDASTPTELFHATVSHWLDRDPVFAGAEVRDSGRGLHGIVWFDQPVLFEAPAQRTRWSHIVRVVQRLIPTDYKCPGITAMTRPVGSINGRSGRVVSLIKPGTPVHPDAVIALADRAVLSLYRTVAHILVGDGPCPACQTTSVRHESGAGFCYQCGRITLEKLLDQFFRPLPVRGGAA